MIPRLRGWSFELLPDGFAMGHPEGPHVALVHYRERVHPVARVESLARAILGGWRMEVDSLGPVERTTTAEGEYGAIVVARGREGAAPVTRALGFVLTDDFYSVTTVTCRVPQRAADAEHTLRELLDQDVHALGVRRRRYEYTPPAGFQPVRQSLITEWIPPDYPANRATICVYPATPRVGGSSDLVRVAGELAQLGYLVTNTETPVSLVTGGGLGGEMQQLAFGRPGETPGLRVTALLADDRYAYPVHVSSHRPDRWDEAKSAFLALLESIQPLPGSHRKIPEATAAFHWLD